MRFALQLWSRILASRPNLILFDHLGLGRSLVPFLPIPLPRYAVFVHGLELAALESRLRADVLRRSWRILANSEHTARELAGRLPEVREKTVVVPLCVEPARIDEWTERGRDSDVARRPAALIVGRMWSDQPGKGHDALIQAMPAVRERIPGAELWIVGQGDDEPRLRALAKNAGAEDAVVFHGRVSDAELSRLYRTASVFAMPSRQEGFGLVYIEAMWHGLACIGSTVDAAGQVISPDTGRLVPYGDVAETSSALLEILGSETLARSLGDAGRRRVEEYFCFDRFKSDLLDALELK